MPFKYRGCHEYRNFLCNYPHKQETQHEKEDGWKAIKKSKSNQKDGKPPRKEMEKIVPKKTPMETNLAITEGQRE